MESPPNRKLLLTRKDASIMWGVAYKTAYIEDLLAMCPPVIVAGSERFLLEDVEAAPRKLREKQQSEYIKSNH